tara:strand:- start:516 stop:2603 length:2088 start_codon:yes stop_codon:yes gene_type:complete
MLDATTEALVIVVSALVVAIGGGAVQCQQKNECVKMKTCTNTSAHAWFGLGCSFSNYVDLAGDRAYNGIAGETFIAATRGVCAPGERIHATSDPSTAACAPYYTYPNGLSAEIMNPSGVHRHEQACGAWIDAVNEPLIKMSVQSYSFYDDANFRKAVETTEQAIYSTPHIGFTDLGKFYTTCRRTAVAGVNSIRASAVEAYNFLLAKIDTATYNSTLGSLGKLSAHACDAPVDLGFDVSGMRRFYLVAKRGTEFAPGAFREALFALEKPTALQSMAEQANKFVTEHAFDSPKVTFTDYDRLYEGASGRTDHESTALQYTITPEFNGFALLARTDKALASAYLQGLAARCAFNLWGALGKQQGGVGDSSIHHVKPLQNGAALGRLRPPEPGFARLTNETAVNASVVTFGQIRATPHGNPTADCSAMARFLFPDRLDRLRFGLVVPDRLYARLETLVAELKKAVTDALNLEPSLKHLNTDTPKVVALIQNTTFRIPGAPRGSWAGIQRDYVDGKLESATGPLKMALQQADALFQDRIELAFGRYLHCAGPPMLASLSTNGYIYPGQDCSHILLGMLRRPWADVRYDDASLYSRIGYVFAHELAHMTEASTFNASVLSPLVAEYPEIQHGEAIADIVAAIAVIRTGKATPEQVCMHIGQLWCARVPFGYQWDPGRVHPPANQRGDKLCAVLRRIGKLV